MEGAGQDVNPVGPPGAGVRDGGLRLALNVLWRAGEAETLLWFFTPRGSDGQDIKLNQDDNLLKHFTAEPMGEKPVGILAGIGEVPGKKLEERGFDKADVILGQFLVLKKDEDLFQDWLKVTHGTNAKQAQDCFGCLPERCEAFW
ncbi:Barrier-to-autointegration factor [Sciurus carolinensis]|uniref:Barrier-to-autointegration factor n=1 Tax=Sciurus carolinensis TaxID=30640 RepID=A0AA41T461_SCICA|nr:Barrier-to-autointegration factor [Sciurus carolinensis]